MVHWLYSLTYLRVLTYLLTCLEGRVTDAVERGGERELDQGDGAREGAVAEGTKGGGEGDPVQRGAAREGTVADVGQAGGEGELLGRVRVRVRVRVRPNSKG
jgi:hypothetical protein